MRYSDFVEHTKRMKNRERGDYFNQLSEEEKVELIDDYNEGATKEKMFLQVRLIGAAEMIEEEQDKDNPDVGKIREWLRIYEKLAEEYFTLG